MGWVLLIHLLEESQNHSTFVGKLWLYMLIVFRIVLTVVGGESIYYDEQNKFICNTLQPGCDSMCYDTFSPLSQVRFWVFQIVLITTPLLVYLGYAVNKIAWMEKQVDGKDVRKPKKHHYLWSRKQHQGLQEAEIDHGEEKVISEVVELLTAEAGRDSGESQTNVRSRHDGQRYIKKDGLMCMYVFQLSVRTLLEAAFLWGQYYLYGFSVPHNFLCSVNPCPHSVSCYVSRPSEKTTFLLIMYAVSVLCLLLNILEMFHLGVRAVCEMVHCCCCCCFGKTLDDEDSLTQAELTSEDPNRCSSSRNISSSYRDDIKPCGVFTTCRENHMNVVQEERQQHNTHTDNLARTGWECDPQSVRNDLCQSKKKPRADRVYCEWQGHSNNDSGAHGERKHQQVSGYATSKDNADSSYCSTEWV